jgi:hypothetical protein
MKDMDYKKTVSDLRVALEKAGVRPGESAPQVTFRSPGVRFKTAQTRLEKASG